MQLDDCPNQMALELVFGANLEKNNICSHYIQPKWVTALGVLCTCVTEQQLLSYFKLFI